MNHYKQNINLENSIIDEEDFVCDSARSISNKLVKQETLTIPMTSKNSSTRKGSDCGGTYNTPNTKKLNSFDFKTATGGNSNKSSFSKKSNISRGGQSAIYEESSFGGAMASIHHRDCEGKRTFVTEFKEDFDRLKYFEDTAVKIYNHLSLTKFTYPDGHENYQSIYKKQTTHNQTVFLDLDDTLIFVSLFKLSNDKGKEIEIIEKDGSKMKMYLYLRPGLFKFLESLKDKFELILFNNGSEEFTMQILEAVIQEDPSFQEKSDYFSYILSRQQCCVNDGGQEVKNLDLFCGHQANRDISRSVIVDNNIYSFQKHLTNGLLIPKYEGQEHDDWLDLLSEYLLDNVTPESKLEEFKSDGGSSPLDNTIKRFNDLRKVISHDFDFERIVYSTRTSQIRAMMSKNISVETFPPELNEGETLSYRHINHNQIKDEECKSPNLGLNCEKSKNASSLYGLNSKISLTRGNSFTNSEVSTPGSKKERLLTKPISQMSDKTYRDCYLSFVKD